MVLLVGVIGCRPESGVGERPLIQNDFDSHFVNLVRCDLANTGYTVPSDESTDSFGNLLSGPMCPVTDDMAYRERLEALGLTVVTT